MKQIFIRGKRTSLQKTRKVVKQAIGSNNFKAELRRGEVHLYFPNYVSEKEVEIIAKALRLQVNKMSAVRAILD